MKTKINNVLKDKFFIFIVLFIFLIPHFFMTIPILNKIEHILVLVFSVIFFICYLRKNKINKFIICFSAYWIFLFIISIIRDSDKIYLVYNIIKIFGLLLYVDMTMNDNKEKFLNTYAVFYTIINFINVITICTIFFKPDRNLYLDRIYFLGYDNDLTIISCMSSYILLMYYELSNKNKINFLILYSNILLYFISALMVTSATYKISVILFLVYLILYWTKVTGKVTKIFNYYVSMILSFIFCYEVVFEKIQFKFNNIFSLFGRNASLTGRVDIWQKTLEIIKDKKAIGTGYYNFFNRKKEMGIFHAHCTLLNIGLESGIIGLIIYISIFYYLGFFIKKINNNIIKSIAIFAIFTYFLITIVEVYTDVIYFYLLIVIITNLSSKEKIKFKWI